MKSNAPKSEPKVDLARYEPYLRGTVEEAWQRCLPVWSPQRRVADFPRGIRHTHYTPSFETYLGRLFAERFADDYPFLVDRFAHGSALESACAFDLLDFLAQYLYETCAPLPDALRTCDLPLPSRIRTEIAADWIYCDHGLDTVGKLLEFEHNGQASPGI